VDSIVDGDNDRMRIEARQDVLLSGAVGANPGGFEWLSSYPPNHFVLWCSFVEQKSCSSQKVTSFWWFLFSLSGFFKAFLSKKELVPFFPKGEKRNSSGILRIPAGMHNLAREM
jgi:hypothetical protein